MGYNALWDSGLIRKFRKNYFVYTDSDVVLSDECPADILEKAYSILGRYSKVHKVGPALEVKDIPEEKELLDEVIQFVDSLKARLVPELNQINKANKAAVGTFFSVRNPKDAMRSFGTFISKIDWSKSESLKNLFLPFMYLGEEKE